MWMGNVDWPREVVDAHRAGTLVIFVGAGASIAPPSNLPNFQQLTEEIADDAGVDHDEHEPLDFILGKANAHEQMDVHLRIAKRIGNSASRPNRLHEAIGRLVRSGPVARVVTTNYDRHLSETLPGITEYHGPALPLGREVEGLVYLHGTLTQEPRRLVATDADFGAAYLVDGWAVRFLEPMFRNFTVLFIGYSHNDLAMTYLARALSPSTRRFTLAEEDPKQAQRWRGLGVTVISYPNPDGRHEQLPAALSKWAEQAAMSLLEHRQYTARLLYGAPSGDPDEMSYLEDIFASDDKVKFFIEYARSAQWLDWATGQPAFQRLFEGQATITPLAEWFARCYVVRDDLTDAAFRAVKACGGRLGPQVWSAIARELADAGPLPPHLARWLVLLVRDDPGNGDGWLEEILATCHLSGDDDSFVLLFTHLTTPVVEFRYPEAVRLGVSFEIGLRGDHHRLLEIWQSRPALMAGGLLAVADTQIRQAYRLLDVAGHGDGPDLLSRRRPSIESGSPGRFPGPIDVLVDVARDCLRELLESDASAALRQIQVWGRAEPALLRRLAVYGWACRGEVSPAATVTWLRDCGLLFGRDLRFEVFLLIGKMAGSAAETVLDALVDDIRSASGDVTDSDRVRVLRWIAYHAPASTTVRSALTGYPDFPDENPADIRPWPEGGGRPDLPPMSVYELHLKINDDPAAAVDELRRGGNPLGEDALNLLRDTVAQHPEDGFAVLDTGRIPVFPAVVEGWSAAGPEMAAAERVVRRLDDMVLSATAELVAEMLTGYGRGPDAAGWWRVAGVQELADRVWTALDDKPSRLAGDDWFEVAMNDSGGLLAEFWVSVIEAEWEGDRDGWAGLTDTMRRRLDSMIAGGGHRSIAAQVMLSQRLIFLHAADHSWAESRILPLLDWSDPACSRRCWDGFLASGRYNDRLLEAGLLTSFVETAGHVGEFRTDKVQAIGAILAQVVFSATVHPAGWLPEFIKKAPEDVRVAWIREVDGLLARDGTTVAEEQWSRWMRRYWQDRLESKPFLPTLAESSMMARWAIRLADSTEEAVVLASRRAAGLEPHSRFVREVEERIEEHPKAYGKLLLHLLIGTEKPFYGARLLEPVIEKLRPVMDVQPIQEQLTRLS